jgi:hypothetical protein
MIYPTVRATVRQGQIKFFDDVDLPENATLLITVLERDAFESFTLGEHLVVGLEDILSGQTVEITTTNELQSHLNMIFNEA